MADEKKDLTGIFDLQKLQAENPEVKEDIPEDPFAVNVLADIEKIDSFDSIDQIGMMDHPDPSAIEETAIAEEPAFETSSFEATEQALAEPSFDSIPFENAPASEEPVPADPFAIFGLDAKTSIDPPMQTDEPAPVPAPPSAFAQLKDYSEKTSGRSGIETKVLFPFHLKINGTFGPFERDKLLLFITENPIGLSSADLDMQINAGRVFFPRISEYPAVKLIQDLRDSGLKFILHPSDRESEQGIVDEALHYRYDGKLSTRAGSTPVEIPVISATTVPQPSFQQIEEVSMVQFVRTEVIEVENSPIIQDVMERMIESLKQKARLKGGNALFDLRKEITPLRLPSQYQISLKANVIRLS